MTPIVSAAACANTRVSFLSCLLVSKLLHVYSFHWHAVPSNIAHLVPAFASRCILHGSKSFKCSYNKTDSASCFTGGDVCAIYSRVYGRWDGESRRARRYV